MKVTLVMVSSSDGVVSRQAQESVKMWTSKEDQVHLFELAHACDAIITGRKSFTKKMAPVPYFIFSRTQTSTPEDVAHDLFYVQTSPKSLLFQLEKAHFTQVLLLGGPEINSLFLKEQLVDELILTLEPKLFGKGKHLVEEAIEQNLRLLDLKQLNAQGTLLLKYKIEKPIG